ncbi:ClpB protein, partial [Gilliamella apicola SCGC AB-598-B02]
NIDFTPDGIRKIAESAWQVNEQNENIGARRLHTVLERLMEEVSFDASELNGKTVTIDAKYGNSDLFGNVLLNDYFTFLPHYYSNQIRLSLTLNNHFGINREQNGYH